jgi:hypothetical protein
MKRLFALLAGGLGLRVLLRRRLHRTGPSPADELRERLAEVKAQEQPVPPETLDGRRADVHARARQAIDDLREP